MPSPPIPAKSRTGLEASGAALVARLGGHWSACGGMCRCPAHSDRVPSLSVRPGHTKLLFKCFAGCSAAEVLRALSRLDAGGAPLIRDGTIRPLPADDVWIRSRACELWNAGREIVGSPVERYLLNRSIEHFSQALRFHPRTPLGPADRRVFRRAMIAAIQEGSRVIAVQRTFLDPEIPRRARDLGNPRRMLGRPAHGAVMLASATDILGLAEGIETALSAMILLGIPVWAALGNERLGRIAIPAYVERLVLLPDNDPPGRRAEAVARQAYATPGRTIETIWPWRELNDWNDVLRAEGERGGEGVRTVA